MIYKHPIVQQVTKQKRKIGVALVGLAGITLASLLVAAPVVPAHADPVSTGQVLFEDDFNGAANSGPDQSKWEDYSTCTYNSSAAFGDIKCGDNEILDGSGHLIIPATPSDGSAIRTGDKFSFQYGVMSAWIKMPAQTGYWPAFWSLNNNPNGVDELPVGEVDAVEGYTTWHDVYHAAGHSWTGDANTTYESADNRCAEGAGVDLTTGYHKYSAKIEPGKITYFFDDVQCGEAYTKSIDPSKAWAFGPDVTRGNWLILNLAVGGAGGQQIPASENAQMLVDRVEVRALNAPSAAIVSGATYKVINTCGGKVMEVPGASTAVGTALKTADWTGATSQKWTIQTQPGTSYWKFLNVNSGQAANVAYASTSNGAQVIQYPDYGGNNEYWTITPGVNGNYQINSVNSGKNLDNYANSPAAGTVIDQYSNNTSCGQTWQLVQI